VYIKHLHSIYTDKVENSNVTRGRECRRTKLDKTEKYKHIHNTLLNIVQNIKYAYLWTAKDMQSICI
jgi:hypothetical protein